MSPSFNTAVYFCYKRRDTAYYRTLKVLDLMSFALTHTNLSTRLLYVSVSSLESRCESQVSYIWDEDTTHPVQEDFDFLILLNIILSIHYTEETFLKDIVFFLFFLFFFAILMYSAIFWFYKINVIALLTNQPFLVCVTCSLCLVLDFYVTSCLPWCL